MTAQTIAVMVLVMLGSFVGRTPDRRPERCSIIRSSPWERSHGASGTTSIVRMTADSLSDGIYFVTDRGTQRDSTPKSRRVSVYGHVGHVADNRNGDSTEVVIVWWRGSVGCGRNPGPTLRVPAGAQVFLGIDPRPRGAWINGMPTYDIDDSHIIRHKVYEPSLERATHQAQEATAGFLSTDEYAVLNNLLPDLPHQSFERVMDWARRNPELAERLPASELISGIRIR